MALYRPNVNKQIEEEMMNYNGLLLHDDVDSVAIQCGKVKIVCKSKTLNEQ